MLFLVGWVASGLDFFVLNIDSQLYIYDVVAGSLSPSLFTIAAGTFITPAAHDGINLYFGYGDAVYQMPVDGSAIATVLTTESGDVNRVELTENKVAFTLQDTSFKTLELKVVAKTGGASISVTSATGTDDLFLWVSSENYLYYNIRNTTVVNGLLSIVPVSAGIADENANILSETVDASWSGFNITTTIDPWFIGTNSNLVDQLILVEGFDIGGSSEGFAGATIKAVNAGTAITGATLGILPTGDKMDFINCASSSGGGDMLCTATIAIDPAPPLPALPIQNDIFYLNTNTANSLIRVTDTVDDSEQLIVF